MPLDGSSLVFTLSCDVEWNRMAIYAEDAFYLLMHVIVSHYSE